MKIGFLGGSFDPVHFGHLMAAQDGLEQLHLDKVILVPAARAPMKPNEALASPDHRLAMLRAATEGDGRFEISEHEIRKGGVSYTIDSVRHFRKLYPGDELFWIIGGDQLAKLPLWKDIAELAQLIDFILLERPGYASPAEPPVPGLRLHRCAGHLLDISSTELRARARKGLSLEYFVPHKAVAHLRKNNLYLQ